MRWIKRFICTWFRPTTDDLYIRGYRKMAAILLAHYSEPKNHIEKHVEAYLNKTLVTPHKYEGAKAAYIQWAVHVYPSLQPVVDHRRAFLKELLRNDVKLVVPNVDYRTGLEASPINPVRVLRNWRDLTRYMRYRKNFHP